MKRFGVVLWALLLCLSTSLYAQHGGTGGGGGTTGGGGGTRSPGGNLGNMGNTPQPGMNIPPLNSPAPILFLTGKVVVDDGTVLTDAAAIQTSCHGNTHTIGYTDQRGAFSLQLDQTSSSVMTGVGDVTDSGPMMRPNYGSGGPMQDWRDCEIRALLPGFISQVVELSSRMDGDNRAEVGNIVLHRIGGVQGFTISATSAQAPSKAKKDFEKGLSLMKKKDWAKAQEKLQAAVDLYPKYAVAWVELGRTQAEQGHDDEAKQSLKKALDADSRFLPAYQEMAQIAIKHQQWKDLADATNQLVQLNPVDFPQYWFLNAVANFYLQDFDAAEKSAARGLETDGKHRIPKLEYVLGLVLAEKHDYRGALDHLHSYIQMEHSASEVELAQNKINQIEALQAAATQSAAK
jgi:lipopolysaccharide biosynthesis regulator YciM